MNAQVQDPLRKTDHRVRRSSATRAATPSPHVPLIPPRAEDPSTPGEQLAAPVTKVARVNPLWMITAAAAFLTAILVALTSFS